MENLTAGRTTMQAPDIGNDYNVFLGLVRPRTRIPPA